jgi:hypothetical protein
MGSSVRVLVLLTFAAFESLAIERLTNIDYIGIGYDVIMGNPHSTEDPGFKQPVFELTYNAVSDSYIYIHIFSLIFISAIWQP